MSNSVLAPHNARDVVVAQYIAWLISRDILLCKICHIDGLVYSRFFLTSMFARAVD